VDGLERNECEHEHGETDDAATKVGTPSREPHAHRSERQVGGKDERHPSIGEQGFQVFLRILFETISPPSGVDPKSDLQHPSELSWFGCHGYGIANR